MEQSRSGRQQDSRGNDLIQPISYPFTASSRLVLPLEFLKGFA
jgi:hypothetical protein